MKQINKQNMKTLEEKIKYLESLDEYSRVCIAKHHYNKLDKNAHFFIELGYRLSKDNAFEFITYEMAQSYFNEA